ncbi:MAG: hypothetical protein HKN90_00860 [Flavobacteriaceae bacterium]|nr:hypothetical protein [Flavobacteriaceae bacterium]
MQLSGILPTFPKEIKLLIGSFLIVLSIGFFTGLLFVENTTSFKPGGIEENYNGNEHIEDADVMKFKKSEKEMLTTVHSHILSMSLIFFLTGIILSTTRLNHHLKLFLMVEPFFSVVFTFGGIYFLWKGLEWMKYIVMFSGTLMTLSFSITVLIILIQLLREAH